MKNRILSLIMAVCMVVLAVPVLVLPSVAAEKEGFTTRFATTEPTWPTYESGVGLKKWNGNWTMGYFEDGKYYQHYDYSKGNNIVTTSPGEWTMSGIRLGDGRVILTQGSSIGSGNEKDANAFYAPVTFKGSPLTDDKVILSK